MNDAIALLAISQLVCIGAIFYLYMQLQELRKAGPVRHRQPSSRVNHIAPPGAAPAATARSARMAYAAAAPRPQPASPVPGGTAATGINVADLARRMRKSEEEVRLLLRRQGIVG
ncbi:MAG TPA: hypothetical protein PL082_03060 [Tepidiformaceae bacterium]|nr:hypothetical protein [Tepidiformaceae bacterium]